MYYETLGCRGTPTCSGTNVVLKNKLLSAHVSTYSFKIQKELTGKKMIEIAEWCDENLKNDYLIGVATSGFMDKIDAVAFKLRWI